MSGCGISGSNLGVDCTSQFGRAKSLIFCATKKAITVADLATEAGCRALFQTGGFHIISGEKNTVTQPERQEVTLDGGEKLKLGVNSASFLFQSIKNSDVSVKSKKSWDGATVYGFIVYANGFIQGKSFDDGLTIEPLKMNLSFNRLFNTNDDAGYTNLLAQLKEGEQESLDENQYTVNLNSVATDYGFSDLLDMELKDIKIEVVSSTSTNQVVTVKTLEGAGVSGLVAADWVLTSGVNTDAVDTLVDNGDGSYSLNETVALSAVGWVLSLKPKTTLSLKGYEPINTDTFTLPA